MAKTKKSKLASKKTVKAGNIKESRRIKQPKRLPSVYKLMRITIATIWQYKRLLLSITLIYGLLTLVLAQGFSGSYDFTKLKNQLDQGASGQLNSLASGLAVFVLLVGSAGNGSSQSAGLFQFLLAIIISLAIIWSLRQLLQGKFISLKDSFYNSTYPLIPFVFVLTIISLQLVPLIIGSSLYTLVVSGGIAVTALEKIIALFLFVLLAGLSFYLLSSSLFAVYIITLPGMTPLKAIRSARELAHKRRWTILRKIVSLPIILFLLALLIMLPIITWLTPLARWTFFILTMLSLLVVHTYMYSLYRELLDE